MLEAAGLVAAMDGVVVARQEFDLSEASDEELRQYALASDRQLSQLQADHARVLAAVDARRVWAAGGDRSCSGWLARLRRRPKAAISALLSIGRARELVPQVAAALDDGSISIEHARELLRCWRFDPEAFASWEAEAVGHARGRSWRDFLRLTIHWCNVVNPDGVEDAAAKRMERRFLHHHRRFDGVLTLHAELDPIGGEIVERALQRTERELFEADWKAAEAVHGVNTTVHDLARTHAQRSADALRVMAERAMAMPAGARLPVPNVVVYVDYQTLTGALCELSSGVQITPRQAAAFFVEHECIDLERIVFGPRNRVIELSVRERFYRGGLARAIRLRDRHCTYEGCDVPAEHCHVDHAVDYASGGETTQENGRAGCPPHNIHKHRIPDPAAGWVVDPDEDDLEMDPVIEAAIRARLASLRWRSAA